MTIFEQLKDYERRRDVLADMIDRERANMQPWEVKEYQAVLNEYAAEIDRLQHAIDKAKEQGITQ